jgi:hypothetical protein
VQARDRKTPSSFAELLCWHVLTDADIAAFKAATGGDDGAVGELRHALSVSTSAFLYHLYGVAGSKAESIRAGKRPLALAAMDDALLSVAAAGNADVRRRLSTSTRDALEAFATAEREWTRDGAGASALRVQVGPIGRAVATAHTIASMRTRMASMMAAAAKGALCAML